MYSLAPQDPSSTLGTVIMRFWHVPLPQLKAERSLFTRWRSDDHQQAFARFLDYLSNHGVSAEQEAAPPEGVPTRYLVRLRNDDAARKRLTEQGRRLGFHLEHTDEVFLPSEYT